MISYREQLAKIGYSNQEAISYRKFFVAPNSLGETMRSMDFPEKFWEVIPGDELDEDWTEEVQGCAFANNCWYFVSNREGEKRLLVFDGITGKMKKKWDILTVPAPDPPLPGFELYHFGSIVIDGNDIYIDHWGGSAGGQILVLEGDGISSLTFKKWIPLDIVHGRVGMIAINFAQNVIVTSGGEKNIDRVYLHSLGSGKYIPDKTLMLDPPIKDDCYAQGGFWSPNNHLYISSGYGKVGNSSKGHQYIYCYSPLNGKRLNEIPVTTEEGKQELEGCCYAAVLREEKNVFIHAVLLENEVTRDDIYFKSFTADKPELI